MAFRLLRFFPGVAAFALLAAPISAQNTGVITGTTTDSKSGNRLFGTNITIGGTRIGVLTDAQGNFRIPGVPIGEQQLVASRIGYTTITRTITVTAGQNAPVEFRMEERAVTLDELVVTSYAVTPRRERTGAQTQVTRDKIEVMPITTAEQAIQGRTAGVQVRTNNGQPGGASTVRIRGVGSINASSNPLYIVDGVQLAAGRQTGNNPSTG